MFSIHSDKTPIENIQIFKSVMEPLNLQVLSKLNTLVSDQNFKDIGSQQFADYIMYMGGKIRGNVC